jgi:hypothetical protein
MVEGAVRINAGDVYIIEIMFGSSLYKVPPQ